jgi:hypothetical protein
MKHEKPQEKEILAEFTTSDEKIGEYLDRIKKIEGLLEAKDVADDAKETAEDELDGILDIIDEAVQERKVIYSALKKKNVLSEKELKLKEEMEFVAGEIAPVISKYYDNEEKVADEQKTVSGVDTNEEISEEIPRDIPENVVDILTPGFTVNNEILRGIKSGPDESYDVEDETRDQEPEHEEYTTYESIIKSMIERGNLNTVDIFLSEHSKITSHIREQIKQIENEGGPEAVNTFISEQQENINNLIDLEKESKSDNPEMIGRLINALRNDFDLLEEQRIFIKTENKKIKKNEGEKTKEKKSEKKESGFKPIDLLSQLTLKTIAVLKTNPELLDTIIETVAKYNKQIDANATKKTIRQTLNRIEELREMSKSYVRAFEEKNATDNKKDKKDNRVQTTNTADFNDEAEKYAAKHGKRKKVPGKVVPPEKTTASVGKVETKEKEVTEDKETKDEEVRMFYTEEGHDYHEISNDIQFNTWLESIEKSIIKTGNTVESEIKSLDDWYQEYQEALPYMEKLNKIFEGIEEEVGNDKIKKIASKEKIADLLYEIHTSGKRGKDKIDAIFTEYQKSIELMEKMLELEETKNLAVKIKAERTRGSEIRELTSNQVKTILESRGAKNTEKNIDEMVDFLEDMRDNYVKKYANKNENVTGDMGNVYSKYNFSKQKKSGGVFKKFLLSMPGSGLFVKDKGPVDYQNVKDMIVKVRDLNLVDRKTGNEDKKRENEARMEKLIAFTKGQKIDFLIEHIQNPSSNKAETLDLEQKEMLKLFDSMYQTFTTSKYRGEEAKAEAEKLLSSNTGITVELDTIEEPKEVLETLFTSNKEEYLTFENEAILQITREALTKLKADLTKFPKTGKNIAEWTRISNKFTEIKTTLESLGEDTESDLDLKTALLQVEDLEMRHINKDVYKDLSANFVKYEKIINSPDRTVEVKKVYINDLLEALKKHRAKKTNTKVQNGVLDDTIKRYEQVLKDIK